MDAQPSVVIVMGSESDLPLAESAAETLEQLSVPFALRVISAHRAPDAVAEFAATAESKGVRVIIAVAGGAAHLAGVVAAHTSLPVIGVPAPTQRMGGLDSLLSTVQMPAGVPVATVGLGRSGGTNAAVLAARILALSDQELRRALARHSEELAERVRAQDENVQNWLQERAQGQ